MDSGLPCINSQLADLWDKSYPKAHPFTNDEKALWSHIQLYTTSKTEHPTEEVAHASQSEGVYRAIERFAGWLAQICDENLRMRTLLVGIEKSAHAQILCGKPLYTFIPLLQPFKQ